MPQELADRCAEGGLLITGGNAAFPGGVSACAYQSVYKKFQAFHSHEPIVASFSKVVQELSCSMIRSSLTAAE